MVLYINKTQRSFGSRECVGDLHTTDLLCSTRSSNFTMLFREDIQKKNCIYKEWNWYHLPYPLPPLLKEWKTKEWNIGMFETPPSPLLRVKNFVVFKVYCNTFVVTFQCSETSLTSSESKQDETKLVKANIQCR